MAESAAKEGVKHLRANELKWGSRLVEAGWTLVPSTILERQLALGLDPVDFNILMQLARYWWKADNPPHPKIATIAECIKKSRSTVQRRLKRMERDGLIEIRHRHDPKHGGQTSSEYLFTGLIAEATNLAEEAIKDRMEYQKKAAARRKRKAPLRVVTE